MSGIRLNLTIAPFPVGDSTLSPIELYAMTLAYTEAPGARLCGAAIKVYIVTVQLVEAIMSNVDPSHSLIISEKISLYCLMRIR